MPDPLSPIPLAKSVSDSSLNGETDGYRPGEVEADEIDVRSFLAPPQGEGELGRLAHYRVLKELGHGGMGMVLLAEDSKLRRLAAIKVMLPRFARDPQASERFLREARAAAKIKHDNIITIFQVDEANGIPFIAMEFLKGEPLDRHLKDKGELSVGQAVRIGREIAEGLQAAHAEGLIHRDIKPANIWLEAPKGRVKILDFGLAREDRDSTHLTKSGAVVGTPAFMAPEQARGQALDTRCDLFSLGVVLYRLCTGRQPFTGPNTMAVLTSLAVDTPPLVRQLNPNVPDALEQLIHRLLAKDRAKRPASAEEVAVALGKIENPAGAGKPVVVKEVVYVSVATELDNSPFAGIDDSDYQNPQVGITGAASPGQASPGQASPGQASPGRKSGEASAKEQTPSARARGSLKKLYLALGAVAFLALAIGGYFAFRGSSKNEPQVADAAKQEMPTPPKPKDSSKRKPDPAPLANADRKAAELFLPHVQSLTLQLADGTEKLVRPGDLLPAEPFHLVVINMGGSGAGPKVSREIASAALFPPEGELRFLTAINDSSNRLALATEDVVRLGASPAAAGLTVFQAGFQLNQETIDALKKMLKLTTLRCFAGNDDGVLAQLKELSGVTNLQFVNLGLGNQVVSERGFAGIASMPLKQILLTSCRVGDPAAFRPLAGMPDLETIRINNSKKFGDNALAEFARCPKLRLLELLNTGVTAEGVKKFSDALPKCKIDHDGVTIGPKIRPPALLKAPFTKEQAEKARAEWAKYEEVPERKQLDLPKGVKLDLVLIPPGQFRMGTVGNTGNEVAHQVTITRPFYMAVTETTQEQYEAVMGKNPSTFSPNGGGKAILGPEMDTSRFPVDSVNWFDAEAFGKKIGAHLPTEAQWEYACRAGSTTKYHFGESLIGTEGNSEEAALGRTTKVASYRANAFGLNDMHGNVSEWCRDWYGEKTDDLGDKDPGRTIKQSEDRHVLRGGSWGNYANLCRAAFRGHVNPSRSNLGDKNIGFRVIVDLSAGAARVDADRRAVELLHPHIDGIWVRCADGRKLQIKKSAAVPNEPFVVEEIRSIEGTIGLAPDFQSRILLPALLPLSSLRALSSGVNGLPLTEDDVAPLAAAPFAGQFRELDARFELKASTFGSIKQFPQLTWLACLANKADDADLARLKELTGLKFLYLYGLGNSRRVSQKGYESLAALPLPALRLAGAVGIDVAAIRSFAAMTELRYFGVSKTARDDLLPEIAKFPKLDRLNLIQSPGVTDRGLAHLTGMKTLRRLELGDGTGVTKEGAKQLSEALPRCAIDLGNGVTIGPKIRPPALLKAPFTKEQAEKARAEWAKHEEVPERQQLDLGKGVKLDLVLIPPGQFRMGTEGNTKDEVPHDVTISKPFYMAVTETTQEQYEAVLGKNPSAFSATGSNKAKLAPGTNTSKFPVDSVNWFDAEAFGKKIKAQVPTEAQWEYACRAGTTADFHFGKSLNGAEANIGPGLERTTKVASYQPNAFGLYDMHGNVREWCRDWYAERTDDLGDKDAERTIKQVEDRRVLRGGSWSSFAYVCRAAVRSHSNPPDGRNNNYGFRVIVELPAVSLPPLAPLSQEEKDAKKQQEDWAAKLQLPVEATCKNGMKMILIPPASPGAPGLPKAYYLGKYEVTQGEWTQVMEYNPSYFGPKNAKVAGIDTSKLPVEMVNWFDSVEFCNKLSKREGLQSYYELKVMMRKGPSIEEAEVKILGGSGYHIPTKAEWIHACRAGTKTKYHFGDKDDDSSEYAWFHKNSDNRTHSVGEKKPNGFGLHDMHGNVREWNEEIVPNEMKGGALRVLRGGYFDDIAGNTAWTGAYRDTPVRRISQFGLRLARAALSEAK